MVSFVPRQCVHSQRIIYMMTTVLLCAAMVGQVNAAADSTGCGDNWIGNTDSGYCYNVFTHEMDWPDAKIACIMFGGHLATITDPIDMQYLADVLGRQKAKLFWSAGRNNGSSWLWPDGTRFDFTNWGPDQHPNNQNTGCMAVDSQTALWQSRNCTEALKPICQKKVPSSSTMKTTTNLRTTRKATTAKHQSRSTRKATTTNPRTTRKATTTTISSSFTSTTKPTSTIPTGAITSTTFAHTSTTTSKIIPSTTSKTRRPPKATTRASGTHDGTKKSNSSDDGSVGLPPSSIILIVMGAIILLLIVGVIVHIRILKRRNNSSHLGGFDNKVYTPFTIADDSDTMVMSERNQRQ